MQWACLVSPSVIYRRNPDSAPDPSSSGTVGATTIDFELSCKSSTGEGKTLTAFCGPLFIRPPEVAGPAPGAWVQLAAGVEELLKQLTLRCSAGRNVCRRRGGVPAGSLFANHLELRWRMLERIRYFQTACIIVSTEQ